MLFVCVFLITFSCYFYRLMLFSHCIKLRHTLYTYAMLWTFSKLWNKIYITSSNGNSDPDAWHKMVIFLQYKYQNILHIILNVLCIDIGIWYITLKTKYKNNGKNSVVFFKIKVLQMFLIWHLCLYGIYFT